MLGSRLNRFQGFLLVSAVLIAGAVAATGLLAGGFFERYVLAQEEGQTAQLVQSHARAHFTPREFEAVAEGSAAHGFEAFLDMLPGVFRVKVYDRAGRIVWANEPQLIGTTFPDNTHLRAALEGRVTTVLEAPKRTENVFEKEQRYIAEVYVPITFPGGARQAGVIETYKDMTAVLQDMRGVQRRIWAVAGVMGLFLYLALAFVASKATAAERRALAGSEARFRSVALSASDGIVLTDEAQQIIFWNEGARAIFGYAETEVARMPLAALLVPSEGSGRWPEIVERARTTGGASAVELRGLRKDGSECPLELALSTWTRGAATCFSAIIRDITTRKEAELALWRSEARCALILRSIPMVVYAARADGDRGATWLSENVESISGFPAGAFIEDSQLWLSRTHPEDRGRVVTELAALLDGRPFSSEYRWQVSDGSYRWFLDQAVLLPDAAGRPIEIAGTRLDITARRRASEDLKREREGLAQNEKLAEMGALLAGVAHELNNPLTVVMGHAELLVGAAGEGPLATRAEKIAQAAERCVRIVRNFLALARQHPQERQRVALDQVVREAVELLAYSLRIDDVEVTLDLAGDLPPLWADPHQLHQVVVNLVTNAHHAMRETSPPRRLTLSARADSARARVFLHVADTGPGIPPEIEARIFEPFFSTKPPGQGTGLGLALCRGMVENHGGAISVKSRPGRGAVFVVELPVGAPHQGEPDRWTTGQIESVRGKTILVVDDEPAVLELLAEKLSADGHHVETALNGARALEKLGDRSYDVILSDLRMPELDGPGLYREVERHHPEFLWRFIFMTGDMLSPSVRQFLEAAGTPSVSKPFDWDDLDRAMRRVLQDRANGAGAEAGSPPPPLSPERARR